jgi:hypothetical protein
LDGEQFFFGSDERIGSLLGRIGQQPKSPILPGPEGESTDG